MNSTIEAYLHAYIETRGDTCIRTFGGFLTPSAIASSTVVTIFSTFMGIQKQHLLKEGETHAAFMSAAANLGVDMVAFIDWLAFLRLNVAHLDVIFWFQI
jgi:hypothetical protein